MTTPIIPIPQDFNLAITGGVTTVFSVDNIIFEGLEVTDTGSGTATVTAIIPPPPDPFNLTIEGENAGVSSVDTVFFNGMNVVDDGGGRVVVEPIFVPDGNTNYLLFKNNLYHGVSERAHIESDILTLDAVGTDSSDVINYDLGGVTGDPRTAVVRITNSAGVGRLGFRFDASSSDVMFLSLGGTESSSFGVFDNTGVFNSSGVTLNSSGEILWSNGGFATVSGSRDVGVKRDSAGVLKLTDGGSGTGSVVLRMLMGTSSDPADVLVSLQPHATQTAPLIQVKNALGSTTQEHAFELTATRDINMPYQKGIYWWKENTGQPSLRNIGNGILHIRNNDSSSLPSINLSTTDFVYNSDLFNLGGNHQYMLTCATVPAGISQFSLMQRGASTTLYERYKIAPDWSHNYYNNTTVSIADRQQFKLAPVWDESSHDSRRGGAIFYSYDWIGAKECMHLGTDGSEATISFLGVPPSPRITLPADATDEASAITLANAIKAALISFGLCD